VDKYGIERGEVLLSLQLTLTKEQERSGGLPSGQARPQPPAAVRSVAPPQAARPTPKQALPIPPAPSRSVVMVDPDTGAGTLQALRRDLTLYEDRPETDRMLATVVAIDFDGLDQIRLVLGDPAAGEVVKGLVEVAPFALRARDRVYRSGWDQLVLFLQGADDDEVESARWGLELALGRFLSDRGFPEVRLTARRVDPAALAV
jgi:GGDEF domain-containing protein